MNLKYFLFVVFCFQIFHSNAQSDTSKTEKKIFICDFPGPPIESATYIGGKDSMITFLNRNIIIPDQVFENEVQGKVHVKFRITKTGTIDKIEIKTGIPNCPDCDQEVIRVMKLMPKWIPSKSNEDSVDSYYMLPIIFDYSKIAEKTAVPEPPPPPDPQKEVVLVNDCGEPFFVGGREALLYYIQKHLAIPDSCTITQTNTRFKVKLLIDTSGNVTRIELLNADFLSDDCKKQIEQVFYEMPNWNPGIVNGQPANRWFSFPVSVYFKED